jgi:hypothetical protein
MHVHADTYTYIGTVVYQKGGGRRGADYKEEKDENFLHQQTESQKGYRFRKAMQTPSRQRAAWSTVIDGRNKWFAGRTSRHQTRKNK